MLNFNTSNPTKALTFLLDEAIKEDHKKEKPRNYLGGSALGYPCLRKLQYDFFNTPKDPGREFTGKQLRIFYRGHQGEEWLIKWLRQAGFTLQTEQKNGKQFGFSVADGLIQGHVDGIITDGPEDFGPYPRLWENKVLGNKYWKQVFKNKLKKARPEYYAQIQLYMAYMELDNNPALWTALNADNMEIYAENVPFDLGTAQEISDKGVNLVKACKAGEQMPRIAKNSDWFECKMCAYQDFCWKKGPYRNAN